MKAWETQFSPTTTWVLVIELTILGLAASAITCWAISPSLKQYSNYQLSSARLTNPGPWHPVYKGSLPQARRASVWGPPNQSLVRGFWTCKCLFAASTTVFFCLWVVAWFGCSANSSILLCYNLQLRQAMMFGGMNWLTGQSSTAILLRYRWIPSKCSLEMELWVTNAAPIVLLVIGLQCPVLYSGSLSRMARELFLY